MSKGRNEIETTPEWLLAALKIIDDSDLPPGYRLPEKIDVDFGFTSHGKRHGPIGEFWDGTASSNGVPRLIIRCHTADIDDIMASLAHQIGHAVVGAKDGHGKAYRDFALRFGLEGKMREAMPGEKLRRRLHDIAESIGPFPGGALDFEKYSPNGEERRVVDVADRQKSRQLKCECLACEYILRTSAQNIKRAVPRCPVCSEPMRHEAIPEEEPEVQETAPKTERQGQKHEHQPVLAIEYKPGEES